MATGWKRVITLDQVIELLNEALELDREWVERMVLERKICNEALANHPTIQASTDVYGKGFSAGLIGFLNAFFGVNEQGWGRIAYVLEGSHISRFDYIENVRVIDETPIAQEG